MCRSNINTKRELTVSFSNLTQFENQNEHKEITIILKPCPKLNEEVIEKYPTILSKTTSDVLSKCIIICIDIFYLFLEILFWI